jgi:subtilase family serine protease
MPMLISGMRWKQGLILILGILIILPIFPMFTSETGEMFGGYNDESTGKTHETDAGVLSTRSSSITWPMFGMDITHSNVALPGAKGIFEPTLKWDHWTDHISGTGIDSWGSTIGNFTTNINGDYDRDVEHVVYAESGFIYILDGGTGEVVWRLNVDQIDSVLDSDLVFTTPALGYIDNNIYLDIIFGTTDGNLYMYEPTIDYSNQTGYSWSSNNVNSDRVWEYFTAENFTQSSPTIGKLDSDSFPDIAVSAGDKLFAISGLSGTELWNKTLPGNVVSSPVIYTDGPKEKVLITSFRQSNLNYSASIFDAETGTSIDELYYDLGLSINTLNLVPSAAVAELDGSATNDPELIVCKPFEGVPGNGRIFVYNTNRSLFWSTPSNTILGQIDSTPAVGDLDGDGIPEIVVVAWNWPQSTLGPVTNIYAFHGNNGTLAWQVNRDTIGTPPYTNERSVGSPVIANLDNDPNLDVLFATSPQLFALQGMNGTSLWDISFSGAGRQLWSSPAAGDIDNDGFLDVTCEGAVISHVIIDLTLAPADLYLSSVNVTENHPVTIYAIIHNEGSAPAENVKVSFFEDDILIGNATKNFIPEFDSREVSILWTPVEDGSRTLKVIIDPDSFIEETNEFNNEIEKDITVLPSYPDLTVEKVQYFRGDGTEVDNKNLHLVEAEESRIKVFVKNIGDDIASGIIIQALSSNTRINADKELATLDIQESRNVTFIWKSPENKSHNMNFTIALKNAGPELQKNNNFLAEQITIISRTPANPKFISSGVVYEPDGFTLSVGCEVRFTNNRTGMQKTIITNESGLYSFDMADLQGRYQEGDEILIHASDGENATATMFTIYTEDKSRFDNITLVKVPTYAISISVEDSSKEVLPNNKVEYRLSVTNRGNDENDVELTVSDVIDVDTLETAPEWKATLNDRLLTNIQPKDSMQVILTIESPVKLEDARAGDQVLVVVTAKSSNDNTQEDLVGTTTTVGRIYDFIVTFDEPNYQLDPSKNLTLSVAVEIKNDGNDDDTVDLELSAPSQWQTEVNDSFDLLIGEDVNFNITLTCDESINAGVYSFRLNITSSDETGFSSKTFTVEILRPDLEFVGQVMMNPAEPKLSTSISFNVLVRNNGTASADIAITELWIKGSYHSFSQTLNLSAGSITTINFTWTPVETGKYLLEFKLDPNGFLVESNTDNNLATFEIEFYLDIALIENPTFSNPSPMKGDEITISVTLENIGNVDIVKTFTVDFYDGPPSDGGRLINQYIVFDELPIAAGSKIDIPITWKASGGKQHTIYVEANSEHDLIEVDYDNNAVQRTIIVEEPAEVQDDSSLFIALIFIIGIVVILLLVLTPNKHKASAGKKKKPKTGKKKEEPDDQELKPEKIPKKKAPKKLKEISEGVTVSGDEVKFSVVDEEPEVADEDEIDEEEELAEADEELEKDEDIDEVSAAEEGDGLRSRVKRFGSLIKGSWLPVSKTSTEPEVVVDEEIEEIEELEPEVLDDELAELEVAEVEVVDEEIYDELEAEEVEEFDDEISNDEEADDKPKKRKKQDTGLDYSHMIGIR